jgi:nitrate reductase NapD
MNVSSVVVKTAPEHLNQVIAEINAVAGCEVHFSEPSGRIVVTIEGETLGEEMQTLTSLQDISHVMGADLIYSYSEDELSKAMAHFRDVQDAVPDSLKS